MTWGIRLEILTALALAFNSGWYALQTAGQMTNHDTARRTVADVSVIVDFTVSQDEPLAAPDPGTTGVASMLLRECDWAAGKTNISGFISGWQSTRPATGPFDRYLAGNTVRRRLQFHIEGLGSILILNRRLPVEWTLENVRFLEITTKLLPHDAEILGGSAVLMLNPATHKQFVIPSQRDADPNSGKNGYQLIAADGN